MIYDQWGEPVDKPKRYGLPQPDKQNTSEAKNTDEKTYESKTDYARQ